MSACITGCGWMTPLGGGLEDVWQRLMAGESGAIKMELNTESGQTHPVMPVPSKYTDHIGRIPRLRRSSPISYFSVVAGLSAMENAGLKPSPELASRTAVIFAISSGAVVYTRRFYEQIVKSGANMASPMLFPETVYNAPASHLAAQLGIDGPSYTLVGDATVGIAALKFAEQLLDTEDLDQCVVVGAEEMDWILCEAHHVWRLSRTQGSMRLFEKNPLGTVLGEGAAAVVVSKQGNIQLRTIHDGIPFSRRREALPALLRVYEELLPGGDLPCGIISCANGTFIDTVESSALTPRQNNVPLYAPKPAFGEAIGAGAITQIIAGTLALQRGELPPTLGLEHSVSSLALTPSAQTHLTLRTLLISCLGFNQQASGVVLSSANQG